MRSSFTGKVKPNQIKPKQQQKKKPHKKTQQQQKNDNKKTVPINH